MADLAQETIKSPAAPAAPAVIPDAVKTDTSPSTEADIAPKAAVAYDQVRNGEKAIGLEISEGAAVKQLKDDLNAVAEKFRKQGVEIDGLTNVELDAKSGKYDETTITAVKALQTWQQSQGLDSNVWDSNEQYSKIDGVVGLRTMRTIESLLGRETVLPKTVFATRLAELEAIVGRDSGYQAQSYGDAWNYFEKQHKGETGADADGSIPRAAKRGKIGHLETEFSADVPWVSQYDRSVPGAGGTACYRACQKMAELAGVDMPDSTVNRIQVAVSEDNSGRISRLSRDGLERGIAAIDSELAAGRPVIIGTSHAGGKDYNRDGMTDHFVLVTGKHKDADGNTYYTAHDPSTKFASKGRDQRFYVDTDGNLVKEGRTARGFVAERRQELAMVIPAAISPYAKS